MTLPRIPRHALHVALVLSLTLLLAAEARGEPDQGPASGTILVAGEPPLTREVVDGCRHFIEWTLDSAMTEAQAREFEQALVSTWRGGDRDAVQQALDLLAIREQVQSLPEAQRTFIREQMLPDMLADWRAHPEDESSRWMLSVYDASHVAIAAGDPPLTRQMSDAYAEALVFAARQATGRPFEADAAFKDAVAQRLAATYASLAPESRRLLVSCPLVWAALRFAWPEVSAPEREQLKQRWIAVFGVFAEPDVATQAAERALTELEALQRRDPSIQLTPLEMRQAANRMEIVAEHLRHLGGTPNERTAGDLEQTARAWRTAAANAESSSGSSTSAYEDAMARMQSQHAAYVALSNAALTSHVGTMNMISIMSGGPYRYTVR